MSHQHDTNTSKVFTLGLVLNTGFTIFELTVGVLTGSLALIADGMHNLTDSLTLGIAFIAERIGKRNADDRRSYGYGRARIIASLLNSGILIAIAAFIGYEAVQRLNEPRAVPGLTVAAVAAVGIGINGSIALLLSRQRHDLNARSAYTNMLYDTLSSVGALVVGFAIAVFGWTWLDSLVGIVIATMLLYATVGIIRDAVHILLEGVPREVDLRLVKHALAKLDNVLGVDDIHAWTIDDNYYAFSCHLVVDELKFIESRKTVEIAKELLASKYGFKHSTIEVELKDCHNHTVHAH
jgi:cobalt-zinc-cadmium efflux system protein